MLAKPRLPLEPNERRVELVRRRAQLDVPSPAAEARLEDERQLGHIRGLRRADERRVRVRQSGEPERACGQQLVVGHDERGWRVPHVYAAARESLQLAGAAFDAVESLAHVKPGDERDVPGSRDVNALCGSTSSESRPQARAAATSASFVALRLWDATTNLTSRSCGRATARWAAIR